MYSVFRNLAIIILSAKFFGLVARKCKAPQVVGEIIAGLLIGFISTESIISVIGLVLGRGTIISLLLVLFVLPQMLVWGDRFISRTTVKGRRLRLHPLFDEDFEQIALRDRARKGK